jgi:D-3-phosphoglycerate dehydrogenase / 2-oxoglutarate reductase
MAPDSMAPDSMAPTRVLITDYAWPSLAIEQAILPGVELLVAPPGSDAAQLLPYAPNVQAILTCWRQLSPALLDAAPHCRIVSRYGIGLDNIPVEHATQLGIVVTNVPDFCLDEVAEHTMALLLACARRIVGYATDTRQGIWNIQGHGSISRLRGQTLGVIGWGNLAQAVAARAQAFGLHLLAYTPRLQPGPLVPWGRATNDLNELLQQADYVSIHVPLTAETRALINRAALRQMKPSAYLINTSRGAVVDEEALYQALQEGWIAGAAVDVLAQEPPAPDHPLLQSKHVIATPHAAFYSEQALEDLARKAAIHVAQALRGQIPDNVVNPAVLNQPHCRLNLRHT